MTRSRSLLLAPLLLSLAACGPGCGAPAAKQPEAGAAAADAGAAAAEGAPAGTAGAAAAAPTAAMPADAIQEARGVDLSKLSEAQRASFFQMINTEQSACGKAHSLAKSLKEDASCRDSMVVAQVIADALADARTPAAIKSALPELYKAVQPQDIPLEGSAIYGDERAPVTMVVFADFQCPHCAQEYPVLLKTVDQMRGRVRLVFKHFPLGGHPRAREAANAVEVAKAQGKFFEMARIVFEHQTKLEDAEIEGYAKEIGLDVEAFRAAYTARKGEEQVTKDRALGEKLDLGGTPTVYVNGRLVNPVIHGGDLMAYIDDALNR